MQTNRFFFLQTLCTSGSWPRRIRSRAISTHFAFIRANYSLMYAAPKQMKRAFIRECISRSRALRAPLPDFKEKQLCLCASERRRNFNMYVFASSLFNSEAWGNQINECVGKCVCALGAQLRQPAMLNQGVWLNFIVYRGVGGRANSCAAISLDSAVWLITPLISNVIFCKR